jgi:hypothetical protein
MTCLLLNVGCELFLSHFEEDVFPCHAVSILSKKLALSLSTSQMSCKLSNSLVATVTTVDACSCIIIYAKLLMIKIGNQFSNTAFYVGF